MRISDVRDGMEQGKLAVLKLVCGPQRDQQCNETRSARDAVDVDACQNGRDQATHDFRHGSTTFRCRSLAPPLWPLRLRRSGRSLFHR